MKVECKSVNQVELIPETSADLVILNQMWNISSNWGGKLRFERNKFWRPFPETNYEDSTTFYLTAFKRED